VRGRPFAVRDYTGADASFMTNPRRRCVTVSTEVFFSAADTVQNYARSVCRACPVRQACLSWAMETGQEFGVFGGVLMSSPAEVEQARRGRRYVTDTEVRELCELGLSDREAARRLGVDKGTVKQRRELLGLPRNYNGGHPIQRAVAA
jgi:hypothetical protein